MGFSNGAEFTAREVYYSEMRWSEVRQRAWWVTRDLLMFALALGFVVYIVEGVVRMIRRGGRLSIGGFVIIVVVSVLALAIVLPGLVALWVAASDIFRVLLGNETEIED